MGVAFRELRVGRSRWRLPQSRDRGRQGSIHCGYCAHGYHLLPMDHAHRNASTPATRWAPGMMPVAVSLSSSPPTAAPSSVMSRFGEADGTGAAAPNERRLTCVCFSHVTRFLAHLAQAGEVLGDPASSAPLRSTVQQGWRYR